MLHIRQVMLFTSLKFSFTITITRLFYIYQPLFHKTALFFPPLDILNTAFSFQVPIKPLHVNSQGPDLWIPWHFRNNCKTESKGSDIQHWSFFDRSRKRPLQWESSQPEQRRQWLGLRCWGHPMNTHRLQIKRESVKLVDFLTQNSKWEMRMKQQNSTSSFVFMIAALAYIIRI